jgi:hypothetical protein
METISTSWYSTDDMAVSAENMTFISPSTAMDGVSDSEDTSAWITEVWNGSMANSSGGNNTYMPHCDADKPLLIIIITQVATVPSPKDIIVNWFFYVLTTLFQLQR